MVMQLPIFEPIPITPVVPKNSYKVWKPIENEGDIYRNQFQTPIPVAKYMASLIPTGTRTVLEPTPGVGNIVSQLDAYELTAPSDFFALQQDLRFDCILTNPPFSTKYAFGVPKDFEHQGMRLGYYILVECMKMSDRVIALMPWFTISDSDVRLRTLKEHGMRSITALPRKTFQYARIQTCILELHRGYKGPTEFKTFSF